MRAESSQIKPVINKITEATRAKLIKKSQLRQN